MLQVPRVVLLTVESSFLPLKRNSATTVVERLRVLLVDDNPEMLQRVAALLTPEFDIVGTVQDGTSVVDAARRLHPQVIVLDISMPGTSGLEVAVRLKRSGSTASVVFLTIHEDEEVVAAAKNAGGVGYVLKFRLASELPLATRMAGAGLRFASSPIRADLW